MDRKTVTDEVRLEIYDVLDDLKRRLLDGTVSWKTAKPRLLAIAEDRETIEQVGQKKHDLAEERRIAMEQFLRARGFPTLAVPKSDVSNREFARREKLGQQLFFMPFTTQADYDTFMTSVGQATHWTVADQAERAKIGWEFSEVGYWFWAEVAPNCPRIKTSWNTLTTQIRLLSLEEYVIVWHATKAETQVMLDHPTWCWLRSRYGGSGALRADGYDGLVRVDGDDARVLSGTFDNDGGRSAEVV
ncbi:MAG: hypothetical protein Q8P82_02980 [bacterium]|nr:hypothetical protein [bacterium]